MIYTLLFVIQVIALAYLGGAVVYLLVFAIAGSLQKDHPVKPETRKRFISIVIPAFMEDPVIMEGVKSALQQDYPTDSFEVILVADSFREDTLAVLRNMPLKLVEVNFDFSTKAKSLQESIGYIHPATSLVLILDADNIMEDGFLNKVNRAFESNNKVIQCHRVAKNTNTSFALLDGISEEINNNIFRSGHCALGLSSALIGSAMAFDAELFRKYIPRLSAVGGFDKELELMLLRDRVKIGYLKNAYVLDEKVQNAKVFYKQRKRWIFAQFYYFGRDILPSLWQLVRKGNLDYFDKALQFSLPPRIVLLGLLVLINLANLLIPNPGFQCWWLAALIMVAVTLLVSAPRKYYTYQTFKALVSLPKVFFLMILILLHLRGGSKNFNPTEHSYKDKP